MISSIGSRHDLRRAGKFGAVGIVNTLLDFSIFNACSKFLGLALIPSNIISTTIAMAFSFTANRRLVFRSDGPQVWRQGLMFLLVTAFGLYIIQTGIIHLLTAVWRAPLELAVSIVRHAGLHLFSDAFYVNNGAKAVATVASLVWNYIMYKRVVFK